MVKKKLGSAILAELDKDKVLASLDLEDIRLVCRAAYLHFRVELLNEITSEEGGRVKDMPEYHAWQRVMEVIMAGRDNPKVN